MTTYLIVRASSDGDTLGTNVYVTGPHFGQDIYSSTKSVAEATHYTKDIAERTVNACRSWRSARIVPSVGAKDLA